MLREVERRVEMMQVARRARKARPVLWRKQDLKIQSVIPALAALTRQGCIFNIDRSEPDAAAKISEHGDSPP